MLNYFYGLDKFISGTIIRILYGLYTALAAALIIVLIVATPFQNTGSFFGNVSASFGPAILLAVSILIVRVLSEAALVLFDIRQALTDAAQPDAAQPDESIEGASHRESSVNVDGSAFDV